MLRQIRCEPGDRDHHYRARRGRVSLHAVSATCQVLRSAVPYEVADTRGPIGEPIRAQRCAHSLLH